MSRPVKADTLSRRSYGVYSVTFCTMASVVWVCLLQWPGLRVSVTSFWIAPTVSLAQLSMPSPVTAPLIFDDHW